MRSGSPFVFLCAPYLVRLDFLEVPFVQRVGPAELVRPTGLNGCRSVNSGPAKMPCISRAYNILGHIAHESAWLA